MHKHLFEKQATLSPTASNDVREFKGGEYVLLDERKTHPGCYYGVRKNADGKVVDGAEIRFFMDEVKVSIGARLHILVEFHRGMYRAMNSSKDKWDSVKGCGPSCPGSDVGHFVSRCRNADGPWANFRDPKVNMPTLETLLCRGHSALIK